MSTAGLNKEGLEMKAEWLKWIVPAAVLIEAVSSGYLFLMAFGRKKLWGVPTPEFLRSSNDDWKEYEEKCLAGKDWIGKQKTERMETVSKDGLKLSGRMLRAEKQTEKTIIAVHGYRKGSMDFFAASAKFYHDLGYNILFVDDRAHGSSEGKWIGFGWKDRLDICSWCEYLVEETNGKAEIALLGISMGAAAVMMASGERLPEQVKCIIEDCGFDSVWDQFMGVFPKKFLLPKNLTLFIASLINRIVQGYHFKEACAAKQLQKNKLPILFIHGDADDFVPVQVAYRLHEAAVHPSELLIVKGAGHALSYTKDTEAYENAVREFLERNL